VRRLELIGIGLVVLAVVAYWLQRGAIPPEVKRLEAETDRLLEEMSKIPGGIQGPHRKELERLLEKLERVYRETMRLAKQVEAAEEGSEFQPLRNHLGSLRQLAARQREILLLFWRHQTKEKKQPAPRSP
jgi:hypothetical protein